MITLTKEWLLKTITELEEERDATPGAVNEDAARALEAMKIALASLGAEAVAYIFMHPAGRLFWSLTDESNKGQSDVLPVYTAPPAPVSERELAQMFGIGSVFKPQILSGNEVDCDNFAHYQPYVCHGEGCPAAMLQGADQATVKQPSSNSVLGWLRADYQDDNRGLRGNAPLFVLGKKDPSTVWGLDYIPLTSNSPVIPDGWVACSERMPETAGNYWGWWSESKRQGPVWFIKSELQAQFQSSEITHWMPLPAAPQQEDIIC